MSDLLKQGPPELSHVGRAIQGTLTVGGCAIRSNRPCVVRTPV